MDAVARAGIVVRAPPERVFDAFAEPQHMSRFWFTRRDKGLVAGTPSTWYLGAAEDAPSFEVAVKEVARPHRLRIAWQGGGPPTEVLWTFEPTRDGHTLLTIEESGFQLEGDALVARLLDATGGFNQVAVAAKALIEHGTAVNVVAAHP